MAPDVNVLVAAFRPNHTLNVPARAWLSGALASCASGGTVEILPMVATGFLRLVTNRKVFPAVAPMGEALAFLKALFSVPGVTMPSLGPEWARFERLCVDLGLKGNDIPDAWIAAAVSVGGYHFVTFDSGFRRFLRPAEFTLLEVAPGVGESRAAYRARRRAGTMTRKRRSR